MILIVGGAGFIGSNLLSALCEEGRHDVAVCDRLSTDVRWQNLTAYEFHDFLDPSGLSAWMEARAQDIEMVFNLGAISSTVETDAGIVMRANYEMPARLWDLCSRLGIRLIHASSAATYGDGSQGFDDDPSPTALARLRPLNLYGWSKHMFDRRCARLLERGGPRPPQFANLKFFNVYGPKEHHKGAQQSLVPQAVRSIEERGRVRLFRSTLPGVPDGGQRRDFVWVGDCVRVMRWLLASPAVSGLFNVGTGQARSFNELVHAVFDAMGVPPQVEYVDMPEEIRTRYQNFTEARMNRLRRAGYAHPFVQVEEGVAMYVRELLKNRSRMAE